MLQRWVRLSFWLLLTAFSILVGCGKPPSTGRNSTLNPNQNVNPNGCQFPLQVSLTIASPLGVIAVNQAVTFKVRMQGCFGSYVVSGPSGIPILNQTAVADASNNYTAELSYTKTFAAAGTQQESVSVTPLSATGAVLPSDMRSSSLDVAIGGGANPSAPTCEIRKMAPIPGTGQPALFALFVLSGTSSSSIMNGSSVVPGTSYPIAPSVSDGKYSVYGSVMGSGGTGLCQLVVTPPACSLVATSVTNGSVSLQFSVSASVRSAKLNNATISLPTPPSTSRSFSYATTGAGLQTITIRVEGDGSDQGSCSTTFNRCREVYTIEDAFAGNASPFKDLGPGASDWDTFFVVNGIWAGAGGTGPADVLVNLRGGDRVKFEQISGNFYWFPGLSLACTSGQDFSGPSVVPVLQFADDAGKVVSAPVATANNRNAMSLRDLVGKTITVPAGATGLYGSVADSVSSDNSGACELRMRVTPACQ